MAASLGRDLDRGRGLTKSWAFFGERGEEKLASRVEEGSELHSRSKEEEKVFFREQV